MRPAVSVRQGKAFLVLLLLTLPFLSCLLLAVPVDAVLSLPHGAARVVLNMVNEEGVVLGEPARCNAGS